MKYNTTYGKYYVYEHILYGHIFWVGSGNWQRPYRFDNRSKLWWNYVKDRQNDIQINIVKEFEDKSLAYNYEIEHSIMLRNNGEPIQGLIGCKRTPELRKHQSEIMKGHYVSEETKEKIKTALSGKTRTLEQRENISKGMRGKPSNMKGKHHTEEAKIKIGNAARGRKMSEETKKKISKTMKKNKGEL